MGLEEFLKVAATGPNAVVYTALNIIALFAMRSARVGQTLALTVVAVFGAIFGGLNGLVVGLTTEGVNPYVLYYNIAMAVPVGAAASLLGAALISKVPEWTNLWPVSDAKAAAEAIRDPLNPAQPPPPAP